jgi:hypothetical protein
VAAAQTVDALYLSNLGRTPDVQERAERAGALRKGQLSPSTLIDSLRESAEGQARLRDAALPIFVHAGYVAPRAHFERLVEAIFRAVLGRAPEAETRAAYAEALRQETLYIEDFGSELIGSSEAADRILSQGYLNQHGHLAQLIDAVFLTALGRRAEDEARAAYAASLQSEDLTIESFIAELMGTQEAADRILSQGYLNQDGLLDKLVEAIFRAVLGRAPEAEARAAYAEALRQETLYIEDFGSELIGSSEAADRILSQGYLNQHGHLAQLIDAVFLTALGRRAEDEARAAYTASLQSEDLTIESFIAELVGTQEAADRILSQGYLNQDGHLAQLIDAVFLTALGRRAEDEARAAYAASLQSEDLTIESFIAELVGAQEAADRIVAAGYVNRPSYLRGLIDAVFKTALGRHDEGAAEAFASAVEQGDYTLDRVIDELSTCSEAKQRAFDLVEPILKDRGYTFADEHYAEIVDTMFRSIIGRPADDAGRETFVGDLVSGRLTVETAIERLMNSDEVRLRVRYVGLPDVLEGIYRTIMGAPETDPALRSLIRSAASQSTFETIKNMSLSAEARHYIMRPILKAHSQQFLSAASAASAAGATPV